MIHEMALSLYEVCQRYTQKAASQGCDVDFHFTGSTDLQFEVSDIKTIAVEEAEPRWQVFIEACCFGLLGTVSPLPNHDIDAVLFDEDLADTVLAFYQFFNHHFLQLLWQLWRRYHPMRMEPERLQQCLGDLTGIWSLEPELQRRLRPFQACLLNVRQLSQSQLCHVVTQVFQLEKVWVEPYVLGVIHLPECQQVQLGQDNSALGEMLIGTSVPQRHGQVIIHIALRQLSAFLPNGVECKRLRRLLRWLLPPSLQFQIAFHAQQATLPRLGQALYCGWTSHCVTRVDQPVSLWITGA